MANVLVQESSLQDIADAIRTKNGTQNTYKPAQMADAIEAISGGGITPTGTINITANGTHDVTNYASANVNVPTGTTPTGTKQISIIANGTTTEDVTNYASAEITVNVPSGSSAGYTADDIANKAMSGDIVLDTATDVPPYCFAGHSGITSVYAPNVTSFGSLAFSRCTGLQTINFPKNIGSLYGNNNIFEYCSNLVNITNFNLTNIVGSNTFLNCINLPSIVLKGATMMYDANFSGCSSLAIADFGASFTSMRSNNFLNCASLNKIILRNASIVTLSNINNFSGTPFASGGTGGTIYVPSSLIASYQSATNWSTLDGYGTVTWEAIEGSQYENYYADGTAVNE